MMTREQLNRLNGLLIDAAITASLIELRALAGEAGGIAEWAECVRDDCVACMRLAGDLREEVDGE